MSCLNLLRALCQGTGRNGPDDYGSGMAAVKVAGEWHKSSYSGESNACVEIAANVPGVVRVRDSKDPGGPVLAITTSDWRDFSARLKSGAPAVR